MNKTVKRIVLISLFALFFVIGGISIFYAQGYRFDTDSLSIKKVGAIYVKTIPGEAQVTLDGEVINKSYWLFNSGKLIQSLFPKNYELVVENQGFKALKYNILVFPSLVSELSHIMLIPENPEEITNEVYQAEGTLSSKFPLVKKANQTLYFGSSPVGKYEPVTISENGANMLASGKAGLYYVKKSENGQTEVATATISLYPSKAKYYISDKNNDVFSFTNHEIYNLQNKNKPARIYASTSTISIPAVGANKIAWIEDESKSVQKLAIYNQSNNKTNRYSISTESKITDIKWQPDEKILIFDSNENLYTYSEGAILPTKTATKVKLAEPSPDSKKIAVAGPDRLEIFMENGKYFRADTSSIGYPEKIIWLRDSGHILLKASGDAYLIDIDTFIPENFQKISKADALWYDQSEDAIYLLLNAVLNRYKLPS